MWRYGYFYLCSACWARNDVLAGTSASSPVLHWWAIHSFLSSWIWKKKKKIWTKHIIQWLITRGQENKRPVVAWTVVIKPSRIPNSSCTTCQRQFIELYKSLLFTKSDIQDKNKICNITNLGKRCKAIGGTACIRDYIHVWFICLLIYSNNKHGCVRWWGRYDDFLGATLQRQRKVSKPYATLAEDCLN